MNRNEMIRTGTKQNEPKKMNRTESNRTEPNQTEPNRNKTERTEPKRNKKEPKTKRTETKKEGNDDQRKRPRQTCRAQIRNILANITLGGYGSWRGLFS